MIDFSKYTLQELQAITDALDKMAYDIVEHACSVGYAFREYYDHASAVAEKKITEQALDAGEDPPANNPLAEEPDDLQALVDTLSRCSDCLAALALKENRRFEECSRTDTFIKFTVLRNANRAIIDLLADIRDHYDGLH